MYHTRNNLCIICMPHNHERIVMQTLEQNQILLLIRNVRTSLYSTNG